MDEERLKAIIQRMIDNNEPPEKIREAVSKGRAMMAQPAEVEEAVEETTFDPFKPAGLSEEEYTSTKELIKEIPSTKKPEVKEIVEEEIVKEKEVVKDDGKKDISFKDFDNVSEEDLVPLLAKQYGVTSRGGRFEFDQDTPGKDVLQIYDTKTKKYHHLQLNTKYNREQQAAPQSYYTDLEAQRPKSGKEVYTEFLRIMNSGNEEKVVKKDVLEDGSIVEKVVQKTYTGEPNTKYFMDVEKIGDNPYIADSDVSTVKVEVPQHYVNKAIDALEQNEDLTDMDAALKFVYDEDKNMQGALNFQNMMSQQEDQKQKEITTFIQETITQTGDENRDFNANPLDGVFDQSLAEVDEMGGMVDMTQESYNDFYIYSNYAQNMAGKDEIFNKYYKLGLPQWDHEAKYQQAKFNWEIAEGLRDPQVDQDGNIITQPKTSQPGEKPTAYEMYATLASERAQYLKGAINTWLDEDPIGQQVNSAYQGALQEATQDNYANQVREEITSKSINKDATAEEIDIMVTNAIANNTVNATRDAWVATGFNEVVDEKDRNTIANYFDKFNHRLKQRQDMINASTLKYMKEGNRPDVARELALKAFPLTEEDLKLQEQYLAYSQNLLDGGKVDIYRKINGDYGDDKLNFTTDEKRDNKYYTDLIQKYQYYNPDFLDNSIYQNRMELLSLAPQLLKRNLEWITESSVAQGIYNTVGEAIGSDQSLAADIKRFEEMVKTGKIPDNLTTIPNSDSPIVKAWNDAVEMRTVLGTSRMLNVNLSTLDRQGISETITNILPHLDATTINTNKAKRLYYEQLEKSGYVLSKEQMYDMEEQHAGLERAMDMAPGLFVMGGEMALGTLMTGGAANVANLVRGTVGTIIKQSARLGVTPKVIQSMTKYATAIGAETYALQFSSEMERGVFNKKDVMSFGHNVRLATTLNLGRGLIAKSGQVYSKAIINTAKKQYKQGNKALWNYLKWEYKTAGIESVKGMMNQVVTTPLTAATLLQAEGAIEGVWGNITGGEEKGWDEIWHDVTDSQTLIETYGAMLTMQLSHPNATRKQIIEKFRRDIDRFRGDDPAWNSGYREIGLGNKKGDEFHTKGEVDQAIGEKIQEIEKSDASAEQKQQQIDYYKSLGKKLNMKPTMVQLGRSWEKDFLGAKNEIAKGLYDDKEYNELDSKQKKEVDKQFKHDPLFERFENLQITSKSLQAGNALDATDMMNIAASGAGNGNQSPITELIRVGFDPKSATNLTTWATQVAADVRSGFSQNPAEIASKTGRKYTQNIIDINRREFEIISLEESLKGEDGLIAKHGKESKQVKDVEAEVERLEKSIELIDGANTKLSETQWEKENILDLETIQHAKDADAEVIELKNEKEVNDFYDNYPGELKKTSFGYYGRDKRKEIWNEKTESFDENPNYDKSIFIINKKAIKEGGAKGTVIHEIGHAATDVIVGDAAINERAKQIQKENPNMPFGAAKKLATNEKLEYIDNVRNELKKRDQAHYDKVEEQMLERPDYEEYKKKVEQGGERDIFIEKEFLTEFIQLASQKAFAGSKGIQGEIKEVTSLTASSKPSEFVDFVLKGGMTAKGGRSKAIEQTVKDIDVKEKKYGTKDSKVSASEKGPAKIENIKSVGKDAEVISAEQVEKIIGRVAGAAWNKYGSRIPKNIADAAGITRKSYIESAKAELYKPTKGPQWIKKWNGDRQPFNQYVANKGMLELKTLATELGVESKGAPVKKRISDKIDSEGTREFDVASKDLTPEEAYIAKEGTFKSKEILKDRVDPRSEISDPKKRETWDKDIDTEFDKKFTTTDKKGNVKLDLEKLENIDYSNLGDLSPENTAEFFGIDVKTLQGKNPRYSRTDKKGKVKVEEGRVKEAENYNLNKKLYEISEKYVKLLSETQLFPKDIIEADITKAQETYKKNPTEKNKKALQKLKDIKRLQGEQKTGDQTKQGTSLGIDPSILKALYETSDIRAMTGPGPKIKSTKLNVTEFRKRAGIQPPGEFKSRSLEKLTAEQKKKLRNEDTLKSALARQWGDAVTNKRVREKLEQAKTEETKEAIDKIQREVKHGSSRFAASEKVAKGLERAKELKDFDKELLNKLKKGILKEPTIDSKRLYDIIKKISPNKETTVKLFTEATEVIKKAGSDFTDATTKRLEEERSASAEKQVIKDLQEQIKNEEGIDVTFKEAQDIYTQTEKNFKDIVNALKKAGINIEYFPSIEKNILSEKHLPKMQEAVETLLKDIEFDLLPVNIQKAIQASLTANTTLRFPDGTRANPKNITGKGARDKGYAGTGNYIEKVFNVPGVTKGNKSKTEKFVEKVKYAHIPEPGGFKKNSAKINREVDYKTNPTEWMNRHYELLIGKDLKAKVKEGEMSLKEAWELTSKHNTALKDWYFSRLDKMSPDAAMVLERLQTSSSTGIPRGATSYESISTRLEKDPSKMGTAEENVESHNEHIKERLNESKEFFAIYADKNLSQAQKNLAYKKMVRTGGQYLIDKLLQGRKDASGKTIRISESDIANTLVIPGRGFDSVLMRGPDAGKTVGEVAIRDMGKKRLLEILDKAVQTVEVVEAKQQVEYKPNYNEIGKETTSLVKEANMSTKPKFSASEKMSPKEGREKLRIRDKAFELARKINKPVKKARVFDFDDTVARTKSNVLYEMPNGKKGKISAEEFAKRGGEMEAKGAKWDFSEFNKVVDGKKGPLFEVMKKMKEAAGERDMFILTARSPEAAKAIHKFLKEMGIDIPLENIKGLADSSPYAKSDWILEKASEGYNDFYFADDHAPNVKAVREVLEQIDVKSKVQQARMSASEKLDKDFNKILEEKSGIEWYKDFSKSKGKVVGAGKGKYKIFLPPGAEDFTGLIYPTLGKGKKGEAQLEWYNDNLIKPYNRATRNLSTDKVQLMNDFKGLKKQLDMPKDLRKVTKSGYTKEQAARVYLWDKMGEKIPNLTKTDLAELVDIVNSDGKLKAFADQILEATKGDGYSTPGKEWLSGTMTTDLIDVLNVNKRKKYLEEWQENIDIIYSEKNLNKLEAIYGPKYREALENSIKRMKTGRNRTSTGNKASDRLLDYINGAQGTIMFLNMRSAVLQSISAANFINLGFNNPIKAGRAFLNQKQYWKDFMSIMNSDYLVGRRQGLKLNISESEIADAAAGSTNKAKAVINYILEKGYTPTKFMDSFAIASGGATWYRNKIKDLMKKEGLSEVEAQKKAFEEFMEISERSQQSSDPSKISAQQSSDMGRVFLQFVNTPMQYTRIQKRALQDLANKRGDWKSNISKILYYGVVQNLWFNAMQQGLFALGFGDDEINEKEEKKIVDTANGMADSILRGTGFAGMTISVLKNTIIDLYRRSGRQRPEYGDAWVKLLEFSPAVKSKFGKLKSAAWPFDTKEGRKQIKEEGFSLNNPAFESAAKVISATTNVPLDRLFLKYNNLKAMMSEDTETWKDIALFLGWPEWQLAEGGTVEEDKIRNMKNETKKEEQVQILLDLGYSKGEIRRLKKEEDRVKAIINSQSGKKVKRKRVIY